MARSNLAVLARAHGTWSMPRAVSHSAVPPSSADEPVQVKTVSTRGSPANTASR